MLTPSFESVGAAVANFQMLDIVGTCVAPLSGLQKAVLPLAGAR